VLSTLRLPGVTNTVPPPAGKWQVAAEFVDGRRRRWNIYYIQEVSTLRQWQRWWMCSLVDV